MESAHSRSLADQQVEHGSEAVVNEGGSPGAAAPVLTMIPLRQNKIIHLIRHGQGYHNVAGEETPEKYASWEFEDAHLTEKGWRQAAALKKHIASSEKIRPEVVIVSPLMRTMETAVGAFGGNIWHEGDAQLPLMHEVEGSGSSTAHPAVAKGSVPLIAYESCREQLGVHPCDKRRSLSLYRQTFPGIDLSLVKDEEDQLWKADVRETEEQIAQRGYQFLRWLSERPEYEIAVVSHSSFLHNTLSQFASGAPSTGQAELCRLFANCELRTLVLRDSGSEGNLDRTWFHPDGLHEEAAIDGKANGVTRTNGGQPFGSAQ